MVVITFLLHVFPFGEAGYFTRQKLQDAGVPDSLADSLPLAVAHAIGDAVESAIESEFPGAEILIHQDPVSVVAQERRRMLAHQMGERAGR